MADSAKHGTTTTGNSDDPTRTESVNTKKVVSTEKKDKAEAEFAQLFVDHPEAFAAMREVEEMDDNLRSQPGIPWEEYVKQKQEEEEASQKATTPGSS